MNLFELYGQVNEKNELWLKDQYDRLIFEGGEDYSLVTIALKNFDEYSHRIGKENTDKAIKLAFNQIASCLDKDEFIIRKYAHHYSLIIKCPAQEKYLHLRASQFHFVIRDIMEEEFGKKLYLEMGFCPMIKKEVSFYDAVYFADLCRYRSERQFPETNYDMYYVSYNDQKENFLKYEGLANAAIINGDFKLFLQPKVDLKTGKVTSAEALMRWIDPKLGMIPLSSFLPNIEENGLIREIDIYLFDKACSYLEKWREQYGKNFSISFNMAKAYFVGSFFMPEYTKAFEKYNVPKESICIALLESIALCDLDTLQPLVKEIYDYGFTCALDDFGSGFSSFDILTSIKLSVLKIDRSLFKNINNVREQILIKHIIDIAHDLDMVVVAEGVETKEYVDYLKENDCDYVQGFYYFKPMSVEEFEEKFVINDYN